MEEISIKTHLIITDIHDEYHMNWCGKIAEAKPLLKNGLPLFIIIGTKGRSAVSIDTSRIYIKEVDGNDFLLGVMTHKNIKTFAPMHDKVGFMK